jgi:PIN domain nuclease of toxin-antitoxin system
VTYLLDTHAFIWAADDDERLGTNARSAIVQEGSTLAVSVASAWELSITAGAGQLMCRPTS